MLSKWPFVVMAFAPVISVQAEAERAKSCVVSACPDAERVSIHTVRA